MKCVEPEIVLALRPAPAPMYGVDAPEVAEVEIGAGERGVVGLGGVEVAGAGDRRPTDSRRNGARRPALGTCPDTTTPWRSDRLGPVEYMYVPSSRRYLLTR